MSPPEASTRVAWYYRPLWVLLLLFVVLGPLGLPYLWRSPCFSRSTKVVLSLAVVAYTALLAAEVVRAVRLMTAGMGDLDF